MGRVKMLIHVTPATRAAIQAERARRSITLGMVVDGLVELADRLNEKEGE